MATGGQGFVKAQLDTIPFSAFLPVDFPSGSALSIKISARNACIGSGVNAGTVRLWYNDSFANSTFGATIGGTASYYYLLSGFVLSPVVGLGPMQSSDVAAGAPCSVFKPVGIWVGN